MLPLEEPMNEAAFAADIARQQLDEIMIALRDCLNGLGQFVGVQELVGLRGKVRDAQLECFLAVQEARRLSPEPDTSEDTRELIIVEVQS